MSKYMIYQIYDPVRQHPIYVGETVNLNQRKRLYYELAWKVKKRPPQAGAPIDAYLFDMKQRGELPRFDIIKTVDSYPKARQAENKRIRQLTQQGIPLLNRTRFHLSIIRERFKDTEIRQYYFNNPEAPDYNEARQPGYRRQLKKARKLAAEVGQDAREKDHAPIRDYDARTS